MTKHVNIHDNTTWLLYYQIRIFQLVFMDIIAGFFSNMGYAVRNSTHIWNEFDIFVGWRKDQQTIIQTVQEQKSNMVVCSICALQLNSYRQMRWEALPLGGVQKVRPNWYSLALHCIILWIVCNFTHSVYFYKGFVVLYKVVNYTVLTHCNFSIQFYTLYRCKTSTPNKFFILNKYKYQVWSIIFKESSVCKYVLLLWHVLLSFGVKVSKKSQVKNSWGE